jgi:alkylglycerol monooxygenase
MVLNVVQLAIPFFILLIILELFLNYWKKKKAYRLNDTITDLSCGIMSQIISLFTKLFSIGIFAYVAENHALQRYLPLPQIPYGPLWTWKADGFVFYPSFTLSWVAVFLAVDFLYYWVHRFSHEMNIFWAGHVVHHSSEEYNLAVALRQSSLHGLFTWVFFLPLPLLGVPWQMLFVCYGINLVYQFWIHTRFIGRFPYFIEYIFNTPSHHRVHHGRNAKYIDKNYAGVLIIWDRMFGTFQAEEEEPTYGLTVAVNSWNPVWVNIHFFIDIYKAIRKAKTAQDLWTALWGKPDNLPGIENYPKKELTAPAYDIPLPWGASLWATLQFILTLSAAFIVLNKPNLLFSYKLLAAFFIIFSLVNIGGLLELKSWTFTTQLVLAILLLPVVLFLWYSQVWEGVIALPLIIVISATILATAGLRSYFIPPVANS